MAAYSESPPEPIYLPDLHNLDRMPSWPGWVSSRLESIVVVNQRSLKDGKFRDVPTLRSSLLLTLAETNEVKRHICLLEELCSRAPNNGDDWRDKTLGLIAELLYARPSRNDTERTVEATARAYLIALNDLPSFAVESALKRWYSGACGNLQRESHTITVGAQTRRYCGASLLKSDGKSWVGFAPYSACSMPSPSLSGTRATGVECGACSLNSARS